MPNLAWLTDIHLDFISPDERRRFFAKVADSASDVVAITGDIGEAHTVERHLVELSEAVARPVYFVLGNHDFYAGSVGEVRERMVELCGRFPDLHYLSTSDPVSLSSETVILGHDGWADGGFGDYIRSDVVLNDYLLIREFQPLDPREPELLRSKAERLFIMNRLAREAAEHLAGHLPTAFAGHRHALVLTHVPPFREASTYNGKISDASYLPHFSSRITGEILRSIMQEHPDNRLTVLCGHTHGAAAVDILPNLAVFAGAAAYGRPRIQRVLSIP